MSGPDVAYLSINLSCASPTSHSMYLWPLDCNLASDGHE
jgi:hypothetical protein